MRAVVQRVLEASVRVEQETVGSISAGLLILLGVAREDHENDARILADKIAKLRIFDDSQGLMNRSLLETGAEALVVSQFTLLGDCRKGRRPSYSSAAAPEKAQQLYELFIEAMRGQGVRVATGRFQAMMDVSLINHGPVTLLLDSAKAPQPETFSAGGKP